MTVTSLSQLLWEQCLFFVWKKKICKKSFSENEKINKSVTLWTAVHISKKAAGTDGSWVVIFNFQASIWTLLVLFMQMLLFYTYNNLDFLIGTWALNLYLPEGEQILSNSISKERIWYRGEKFSTSQSSMLVSNRTVRILSILFVGWGD